MNRIAFDPTLPLETHMVLGTLGFDIPEAFTFPDPWTISEKDARVWEFQCGEILKLPIEGAYRRLAGEMIVQLQGRRLFRERADVLTKPIADEGTDEGDQRTKGLLS